MSHQRTYLITGATGFIGSCLLRKLINNGEKVNIIIRKEAKLWRIRDILNKVTCYTSDLSNSDELKRIFETVRPNIIYHLATYGAYSYQNEPDKIIQTNILGTWNLLKAASTIKYELFINTGSSSEYGFKKLPMKETDLLEPASYYAATKCSQTLLCFHIAREEKKPIVTIRPFSVFGPYEEPTRFIPTLMKSLYYKESIKLVSPEIVRDYIYIDDLINAYLLIGRLKEFPGEVFNIGTGIQSSIKEVVETAVRITGKTTDFQWGALNRRMWDTANWRADIDKAKKILGWFPTIDLQKGLSLMWGWFKDHHSIYDTRKNNL